MQLESKDGEKNIQKPSSAEQHQSIDFSFIFIDLGTQVCTQNRSKMQEKRFKMASKIEAFFKCVCESLPDAQWWEGFHGSAFTGAPSAFAKTFSFQDMNYRTETGARAKFHATSSIEQRQGQTATLLATPS